MIHRDQISHIYKVHVWWLREVSQIGQTFIPLLDMYVKKSFETQHGRIPIDPAILAAIGHRFIAIQKKLKIKMQTKIKNAGLRWNRDFSFLLALQCTQNIYIQY